MYKLRQWRALTACCATLLHRSYCHHQLDVSILFPAYADSHSMLCPLRLLCRRCRSTATTSWTRASFFPAYANMSPQAVPALPLPQVNCHHQLDASIPFGGFKMSGFGREHGEAVLHHYTQASGAAAAGATCPVFRLAVAYASAALRCLLGAERPWCKSFA